MKGALTETLFVVFAVAIGVGLMTLLIPKIAEPSLKTISNENAFILAEETASLITALSVVDNGRIEKILPGEWDIKIKKTKRGFFIEFSKDKFKSSKIGKVPIFGDVEEAGLESVSSISIIKDWDGPVRVVGND